MNHTRKRDADFRLAGNRSWVRVAALICCVAWGTGGLGFLPAAIAFLGSFDSVHQILVVGTRAGTEVVFHHQTKESEEPQKHSVLMRLVATVAVTSGESNDHILDFANAEDCKTGTVRMSGETEAPPRGEKFVEFRMVSPMNHLVLTASRNNRCPFPGYTSRIQNTHGTLLRI